MSISWCTGWNCGSGSSTEAAAGSGVFTPPSTVGSASTRSGCSMGTSASPVRDSIRISEISLEDSSFCSLDSVISGRGVDGSSITGTDVVSELGERGRSEVWSIGAADAADSASSAWLAWLAFRLFFLSFLLFFEPACGALSFSREFSLGGACSCVTAERTVAEGKARDGDSEFEKAVSGSATSSTATGSEMTGSEEITGSEVTGSEAIDSEMTGSERTDSKDTNSEMAGSKAAGSGAPGSYPATRSDTISDSGRMVLSVGTASTVAFVSGAVVASGSVADSDATTSISAEDSSGAATGSSSGTVGSTSRLLSLLSSSSGVTGS